MELKEVQEFIKTNADKEEVKSYIKGLATPTPDGIKAYIDSEEGQKLLQPKLDQYFTKGLETWKTNNLSKIVDEQVNKVVMEKYPKETEEQKRLHKLETDLAAETSKRKRAELMNTAISEATIKGLPVNLVKFFVVDDPDSTKAALLEYEQNWKSAIKSEIDKVFKQFGRVPETNPNQGAEGLLSRADVAKMSPQEINANREKVHKSMKQW
jgi:hypothetical protein